MDTQTKDPKRRPLPAADVTGHDSIRLGYWRVDRGAGYLIDRSLHSSPAATLIGGYSICAQCGHRATISGDEKKQ